MGKRVGRGGERMWYSEGRGWGRKCGKLRVGDEGGGEGEEVGL